MMTKYDVIFILLQYLKTSGDFNPGRHYKLLMLFVDGAHSGIKGAVAIDNIKLQFGNVLCNRYCSML